LNDTGVVVGTLFFLARGGPARGVSRRIPPYLNASTRISCHQHRRDRAKSADRDRAACWGFAVTAYGNHIAMRGLRRKDAMLLAMRHCRASLLRRLTTIAQSHHPNRAGCKAPCRISHDLVWIGSTTEESARWFMDMVRRFDIVLSGRTFRMPHRSRRTI